MATTRAPEAAAPRTLTRKRLGPAWVVAGFLLAVFAPPARARLVPMGSEVQVNTGAVALQTSPAVAVDPVGRSIVVWGRGGDIAGRRYDGAGQPLHGEFLVNTSISAFHFNPAVATDALGGFVVVWQSYQPEPSDYVIRGQRYDASGAAVGDEFRVDSVATDRQHNPLVVADHAGGFLVVWEGHNMTQNFVDSSAIFAQRYDDSGEPIGEEFQISGSATRFAGSPAMATDSVGNLVVVWAGASAGDGDNGIFGRRYDATGETVAVELQISDPTSDPQFAPAVAVDQAGGLVVVWQRGAYVSQVFGRRYDGTGMPMGDVFAVTANAGHTNNAPRVATVPGGGFLVAWELDNLSQRFFGPGDVAVQQYLPSGAPEGDEIRVNRLREGQQGSPGLSVDATGNVIVVWHSLPGDASEPGIFVRRFTASSLGQASATCPRSCRRAPRPCRGACSPNWSPRSVMR